jgi:hypothetical protein
MKHGKKLFRQKNTQADSPLSSTKGVTGLIDYQNVRITMLLNIND